MQVVDSLKQGYQAMVFVHSRKDTVKTADKLVVFFSIRLWFNMQLIILLNSYTVFAAFCLPCFSVQLNFLFFTSIY